MPCSAKISQNQGQITHTIGDACELIEPACFPCVKEGYNFFLKYGKPIWLHAMPKLDVPWDGVSFKFVFNDECCSTVGTKNNVLLLPWTVLVSRFV